MKPFRQLSRRTWPRWEWWSPNRTIFPPPGSLPQASRVPWDWDSLLGGSDFEVPRPELVASMPERFRTPFEQVAQAAQEAMDSGGSQRYAGGGQAVKLLCDSQCTRTTRRVGLHRAVSSSQPTRRIRHPGG